MDAAAVAHAANEIAISAQAAANVQMLGIICAAAVTIITLWMKQSYESRKARDTARLAAETAKVAADEAKIAKEVASSTDTKMTEALTKIHESVAKTEVIDSKADTIVHQTNGVTVALVNRVIELEKHTDILARDFMEMKAYNREATHRLLGAVDIVHKKLLEIAMVVQQGKDPTPGA